MGSFLLILSKGAPLPSWSLSRFLTDEMSAFPSPIGSGVFPHLVHLPSPPVLPTLTEGGRRDQKQIKQRSPAAILEELTVSEPGEKAPFSSGHALA